MIKQDNTNTNATKSSRRQGVTKMNNAQSNKKTATKTLTESTKGKKVNQAPVSKTVKKKDTTREATVAKKAKQTSVEKTISKSGAKKSSKKALAFDSEIELNPAELEALYADAAALLSADEEIILATKVQAGQAVMGIRGKGHTALIREGERARARFIEANIRLVKYFAHRYIGRGVELDDLVQEGTLGLMHAITKYDPKRGYRLSTYAAPWIHQYISRAISNGARTVRLPLYQVEALNKMKSVHAKILAETNVEPTILELAKASGLDEARVTELLQVTQSMVYLDAPVGEGGEKREIAAPHFSASIADPAKILEVKMRDEKIESMFDTLRENEATVLKMRYGFVDSQPLSHEQIALRLDLPRESVRQIERDAISKLRHPSRSSALSALVIEG